MNDLVAIEKPFVLHWEIYDGYARIFLCGPGRTDWWPLSPPKHLLDELELAHMRVLGRRACARLNAEFRGEFNVPHHKVRTILARLGWTPDELTSYPDEERNLKQEQQDQLLEEP